MRRAGRVVAPQSWPRLLPTVNADDDDKLHGTRWFGKYWHRNLLLLLQRYGIDPTVLQRWKALLFVLGVVIVCLASSGRTRRQPTRLARVRSLSTNFSVTASSNVSFYLKASPFQSNLVELKDGNVSSRDYGQFPSNNGQEPVARRVIHHAPDNSTFEESSESSDAGWYYYAFDDDEKRNPLVRWDDDSIQNEKFCRRTSWHRDLPIDCNRLHEYDVSGSFLVGETRYLT